MNKIEIPLSKAKTILISLGALIFVALGIFFILSPDTITSPIFSNPHVVRFTGIAAVLFFGAAGVYGFRKLFDKTVGLTIDEKGITDNSNAASAGLIEWADIIAIKTEQVMSTKFLLIFVNNPKKYLDRISGFKQKLMKANMKMYGTPLSITSNTLKYNFNDLERLLKDKLAERK